MMMLRMMREAAMARHAWWVDVFHGGDPVAMAQHMAYVEWCYAALARRLGYRG